MQIQIRQAKQNDAAVLTDLNLAVHNIHADAVPYYFKRTSATDPEIQASFETRLADENVIFFIAEVDEAAVGYLMTILRPVEENAYAFAHKRLLIDQMSVNPDYRSKGVGHALVQRALDLGRELNVDYVTLSVWAFNEEAIAFYQREGFETVTLSMWQKLK
jgi:ribosomal protein S18 acetylase RimI-like enzyme